MTLMIKTLREISDNSRFLKTKNYIQHGNTTCLRHTLAVAHYSCAFTRKLNLKCNKRDLIRGALLHDYFLYDWHEPNNNLHGFTHPKAALKNALEDFELTEKEKNIIVRHMFPLTPIPPKNREAWIVCMMDKWCSLCETFSKDPYKNIDKWIKIYETTVFNGKKHIN